MENSIDGDDDDEGNVDYDDEPVFLSPDEAVEVPDDEDVGGGDGEPMDDDDEEMLAADVDRGAAPAEAAAAGGGEDRRPPRARPKGGPDMSSVALRGHSGPAYAVSAYLDGTTGDLMVLTGGGDDRAFLHRVSPGLFARGGGPASSASSVQLDGIRGDSVAAVAFNVAHVATDATGKNARKLAAAGSYDGTIGLYDAETGEEVTKLDGPTDVEFLSWHPKGGTVLLAGSTDGTVWMYHTPTARCLQVFVGHESGEGGGGGVSAGTFTPDGRFALTAGMDGTLRIWAPKTGMCRHVFRLAGEASSSGSGGGGGGLTCLAADGGPDGQLAVAGGEDGTAHVVHLSGKKAVATLGHCDEAAGTWRGEGGDLGGMDVDGEGGGGAEEERDEPEPPRSVEAVAFAPRDVNPNWVATGGVDGAVKVWDITHGGSGQMRHACRPPPAEDDPEGGGEGGEEAPPGGVTSLRWHPSLPLLFASYADGAVRLWDARDGSLIASLTGGHDGTMINGMEVVFADDAGGGASGGGGRATVVTAVDDGSAKVFVVDVAAAVEAAAAERQRRLAQRGAA